jgi:calcineurin-like phosphoesterase family protein
VKRYVPILILLCGLPSLSRAADEIHWTMTGLQSVTFDWRGTDATLRYGTTAAYGSTVTGQTPSPLPFSSSGPFWEARVSGLTPGVTYHYSIAGGADHTFHTTPPPGSSFTVYVEADVGDSVGFSRMTVVQSLITAGAPSFTLVPGDLTYANLNGQASCDRHFNNVMGWSQDAAYMPTWGNHDWDPGDDLRNYKGRFDFPNPQTSVGAPSLGCCGEDWYWFDAGNVRFIAYPEPYSGAWAQWSTAARTLMDAAQQNPSIHFIVTFGHRPAYSSGLHGSDTTLQGYLNALGDSHSKYVLNLNGHSHDYERSYPQHGVTHVTVGIGGAGLEEASGSCLWPGGCPPPSWSAYRAYHHGTLRLHISPTAIVGDAICGPAGDSGSNKNDITCAVGETFDSFTIGSSSGVLMPPVVASGLSLEEIRPNPATTDASVSFDLPTSKPATLELVDLAGRAVERENLGAIGAGPHVLRMDWSGTPPGVYWLQLSQDGAGAARKITLLR